MALHVLESVFWLLETDVSFFHCFNTAFPITVDKLLSYIWCISATSQLMQREKYNDSYKMIGGNTFLDRIKIMKSDFFFNLIKFLFML